MVAAMRVYIFHSRHNHHSKASNIVTLIYVFCMVRDLRKYSSPQSPLEMNLQIKNSVNSRNWSICILRSRL